MNNQINCNIQFRLPLSVILLHSTRLQVLLSRASLWRKLGLRFCPRFSCACSQFVDQVCCIFFGTLALICRWILDPFFFCARFRICQIFFVLKVQFLSCIRLDIIRFGGELSLGHELSLTLSDLPQIESIKLLIFELRLLPKRLSRLQMTYCYFKENWNYVILNLDWRV